MGAMPNEDMSVNNVDFFKIDQATYYPKTGLWGTHALIANNNTRTVTIPSDLKPGIYIVRHEIIALHHAWIENVERKSSGAQPYPLCMSK
jgi:lytic cellulose monooxygenase (C1-hydroxylating)